MANVLVIGSGGREHAICWRLKQSSSVEKLYCAPGNGGIGEEVECVPLGSPDEIIRFCKDKKIDLVVIGPEQPLVEGLADTLNAVGVPTFGPGAKAARLEGSKGFTKALCKKYGIPTADYGTFTDAAAAKDFLKNQTYPVVVKADGLAAGKGVIIAASRKEAEEAIDAMFSGAFGDSGKTVIIEEFMEGEEASFFALTDGETAIEFGHAQDHKRAYDGDKGPNTGGMGTYGPVPFMTEGLRKTIMQAIILPTVAAMKKEGSPFRGVLFAGLMITAQGPKLIEYNARFGDPETQVLMRNFNADLYPALLACAKGGLDKVKISFEQKAAVCVVMAAKGYPGTYEKNTVIKNLEKAADIPDVKVFHAGTVKKDGKILAVGGRVLGVTAQGATIKDARDAAYKAVDAIEWPEGFCRRDIGWRALTF